MAFQMEKFLPYLLFEAAEVTSETFSNSYKEQFNISRTEWRTLFNIGLHGPITGTEITKLSTLDKTKISRAIAKFEERGWIERIHTKENRRSHQVGLTTRGKEVFSQLSDLAEMFQTNFENSVGKEELENVVNMLNKLKQSSTS